MGELNEEDGLTGNFLASNIASTCQGFRLREYAFGG